MASFCFSATKSQGSMKSYSTKPFDDNWKSLPRNYNGHDIVVVHKVLSKHLSITKDEFETKEQFQQRINNAWMKPIIGNMTIMDKFAFIQEYSEKKYDADNAQFIFTIDYWECGGGILIKNIRIGDNEFGAEVARSEAKAMKRKQRMQGKSTFGADIAGALMSEAMKQAGINEAYTIYMPREDLSKMQQIVVNMSPNEARQASNNMRVLFICEIKNLGTAEANDICFWSHHINAVKVNLEKIIIFNYQSGEIYRTVYVNVKEEKFRSDKMNISDSFLQQKMPEFQAMVPSLQGKTPIEVFVYINTQMRNENLLTIQNICKKSSPKILWEGTFHRMKNTAPMALFGDKRDYFYNDKLVGESVHNGIDLASAPHSPIEAANSGIVVFTGNLGIYGNAVIIDHGQNLFSLYGHLSVINTSVGKHVAKKEEIGISGTSGLAGGDHLHFGIIYNGQFVDPMDVWNPDWVKSNISARK